MSIFRQKTEPSTPKTTPAPSPARPAQRPAAAAPAGQDTTNIASGSKVVGEISGAAQLVIDGRVEGKIDLDHRLVIGENGRVNGEIKARSVQIGGRVVGNVHGVERVEVLASGRLEGDMTSPQVHIAEGAFFTGKVEMISKGQGQGKGNPPAQKAAPKGGAHPSAAPGGRPQGGKKP